MAPNYYSQHGGAGGASFVSPLSSVRFPTYLPQVPQLKELCQQRSIGTKGLKKAELVWSLLSQPPPKQ